MILLAPLFVLAATVVIPLNDLGPAPYGYNYVGGLWDLGSNVAPPAHLSAGMRQAAKIQPLDAHGEPSPLGKIGFISIGSTEPARIFCSPSISEDCEEGSFMKIIQNDARVNHESLVAANGAVPWSDTVYWTPPDPDPFRHLRLTGLPQAGLSPAQVQVAWVLLAHAYPVTPMPDQACDMYFLKGDYAIVLRELKKLFPNLQIAYLSSRTYGGYSETGRNPEPFAYQSAISVRWVLEGQELLERTGTNWDTRVGNLSYEKGTSPWVNWGPYYWANGPVPRQDGLRWMRSDYEADGETLSSAGAHKAAVMLLDFLLHEPTAQSWFVDPAYVEVPPPSRSRAARH